MITNDNESVCPVHQVNVVEPTWLRFGENLERCWLAGLCLLALLLLGAWSCERSPSYFGRICFWFEWGVRALVALSLTCYLLLSIGRLWVWARAHRLLTRSPARRVTWVGHPLDARRSIEAARLLDFSTNGVGYYFPLAGAPRFCSGGVAILVCLPVILAATYIGWSTWGASLFIVAMSAAVILGWQRILPARVCVYPGLLQIWVGKAFRGTSSLWKEVPLTQARVTVWASRPTLISLSWSLESQQHELHIRRMPREFGYYVLIASVTKRRLLQPPRLDFRGPERGPSFVLSVEDDNIAVAGGRTLERQIDFKK